MITRLFRCTLCMTVLPLSGIIFILAYQHSSAAANFILLLVSILHVLMTVICKRAMMPLICPKVPLLEQMGVDYVPAPYEPGRFKTDTRVTSVGLWLGLAAPVLTRAAICFPEDVCVSVLNDASYTTPSMNLLLCAVAAMLIGSVAFPLWASFYRAQRILNEGSDRKRYLLRGFADHMERKEHVREYMRACRRQKRTVRTVQHLRNVRETP